MPYSEESGPFVLADLDSGLINLPTEELLAQLRATTSRQSRLYRACTAARAAGQTERASEYLRRADACEPLIARLSDAIEMYRWSK